MSNYEATRYDIDGQFLTGIEGLNTGLIVPWSYSSIPNGFLECDGTAVSRSTYAALFAVIGTTYGSGNGSTTFNVPDLRDKLALSKSNNKALASTGGANTVTNTGNISGSLANTTLTTAQLPSHTHTHANITGTSGEQGDGSSVTQNQSVTSGSTGGGGAHSHNLSANFTGDATSVLQPYLTLIYIIKT